MGVGVEFVGVGHFPGARGDAVVVGDGFVDGFVFGFLGEEGVAVGIFGGADGARAGQGVGLEDGVVGAVNVGVDAQTEEMLMIVGVDAGVDFGAPALGVFARVHGIGVEDTGEFDFELDGAVLVEDPVDAVFVVGGGEDVGDDEFATASHDDGFVAEIGMFEEDTGVFFVDTDGVFDGGALTGTVYKGSVLFCLLLEMAGCVSCGNE